MVALLLLSAAAPLASAGTLEALSKRITNDFTARLEVDPEAEANAPNTRPRDVFEGHYRRALDEYIASVEASAKDKGRFLYVRTAPSSEAGAKAGGGDDDDGGSGSGGGASYKRYPLGDTKTFASLFFKDKPKVLSLLDAFHAKRGKYAVRGFPHKLGILLHGPPGTGKTSLIKAIAQRTGRNVVSIPLTKVQTNQELMDAVFDLKFNVDHVDCAVKLSFKQTIFVLEDVDAASSVVLRRDEAAKKGEVEQQPQKAPPAIAPDADPVSRLLMLIAADDAATTSTLFTPKQDADRLDLSGVLNVLDGVVDSPGRLLIMSTNHPEKLDPALVRPGRCDLHIHLGFLRLEEAAEMVQHYVLFGREMTPDESEAFATAWDARATRDVTPATLEQICAGADDLGDVLAALAH